MASAKISPKRRTGVKLSINETTSHEVSREELQASIAKAVELRALHAALLQGGSPANLRNATASPAAHSRHVTQFLAHDYPVFTPSYDEEHVSVGRKSRPLSGNWDGYGLDIPNNAVDAAAYKKVELSSVFASERHHDRLADDQKSLAGSCANSCRNQARSSQSSPNTEFILKYARRNSLGDISSLGSSNKPKPATGGTETDAGVKNFSSRIVVPLIDTHSSLRAKSKSKGFTLSWLFPRSKKKQYMFDSSPSGMADQTDRLSDIFRDMDLVSVEKLKKELMKTTEERGAALLEVSEMRSAVEELKKKLEFLENYSRQLKKALKTETKDPQKLRTLPTREYVKPHDEPDGDNSMPVSEEVMVEGFLQIVSEARLSVNQFCKLLVAQIAQTDESLMHNLDMLLQPYKVSLNAKSSKTVLYHLEAIINQTLYQDFENSVFRKNGAPKHLDPLQDRQAQFSSYVALRNLSWNEVLQKGTKFYSEEFSKFCDQKMSIIITMLNWDRPWPEQLLQVFFVAAKCIWLLHLLAFSFVPPLMIMRVEEKAVFDPHFMEDMVVDRHRSPNEGSSSRVKIMVMPGFYVNDKVLRCKVIRKSRPMN